MSWVPLPSKSIRVLRQTHDLPPSRGLEIDGFAEFMEVMSDNVISKGSHYPAVTKDLIVNLITRICTQQEELSHATALLMAELCHAAKRGYGFRACLRNSLASTLFEPEWCCLEVFHAATPRPLSLLPGPLAKEMRQPESEGCYSHSAHWRGWQTHSFVHTTRKGLGTRDYRRRCDSLSTPRIRVSFSSCRILCRRCHNTDIYIFPMPHKLSLADLFSFFSRRQPRPPVMGGDITLEAFGLVRRVRGSP